jgi:hypothetical protein
MGSWRESVGAIRQTVEKSLRVWPLQNRTPFQPTSTTMSSSVGKDLESGLGGPPRSETFGIETPARALSPTVPQQYQYSAQHDAQVESALTRYRYLLGIHRDPALVGDNRLSANKGIYERVIKAERNYGKQYKTYAILINRYCPMHSRQKASHADHRKCSGSADYICRCPYCPWSC